MNYKKLIYQKADDHGNHKKEGYCSECKDHATLEEVDGEMVSKCCGVASKAHDE